MTPSSAPAPGASGLWLPSVHPDDTLELAEHLRRMAEDRTDAAAAQATAIDIVVPFVEALLEEDPDAVVPTVLAEFVWLARMPGMTETIALQSAFGRGVGEYQARKLVRLTRRVRRRSLSIATDLARPHADDSAAHDLAVRLFLGDAHRGPNDDRIRRAIALTRRTTSLLPPGARIDMLCLLAWLHWARGESATALACLSDAQQVGPGHPLAVVLARIVAARQPRWRTPAAPLAAAAEPVSP